jgi:hypothetical protein
MTEIDALVKIANAIEHLANAVGGVGFTLVLFLLFKNMGTPSYSMDKLTKVFEKKEK